MNNWMQKSKLGVAAAALLGAQLTGCFIVTEDDDPRLGTLTVEWSIEGSIDPIDCDVFGADRAELLIFAGRDLVADFAPVCEAFAISIDLEEGLYDGELTLLDSFGDPITFVEDLPALDIYGGEELVVTVDFPAGSFL